MKPLISTTLLIVLLNFCLSGFSQNTKTNSIKLNDNSTNNTPNATSSPNIRSGSGSNSAFVGAALIVGVSQNDFNKTSNGDVGVGLALNFMYNFMGTDAAPKKAVNVMLGVSFEYLYFGGKSNSNNYDDPAPYNAITNKVTTSVNSNAYSLLLNSRVEFFQLPVKPFIEISGGGRLFNGNETYTIDRSQKSGTILPSGITFKPTTKTDSKSLQADFVGTCGYGGGLAIDMTKKVRLELKVMYMIGTKASYIDKESVKIDPITGDVSYNVIKSTTDMLIPSAGVSAFF